MEVLLYSFNAISPIVFCMGVGYFARSIGAIGQSFTDQLSSLCFKVLFPIMLFSNSYKIDFYSDFRPGMLLFAAVSSICIFIVLWVLMVHIVKDRARAVAIVDATFRSNYQIFALPLALNMYGADGTACALMLTPVSVIIFNLLSVVILSSYKADHSLPWYRTVGQTLLGIACNPLIVGAALGIIASLGRIALPAWIATSASTMAATASPMGLLMLGAQIDWRQLRDSLKSVLGAASIRLVWVPLCSTAAAILLGFRGMELCALFVLSGTPSPVGAAVMVRNYGIDSSFSAQVTMATTLLCGFTMFAGIAILKYFHFI